MRIRTMLTIAAIGSLALTGITAAPSLADDDPNLPSGVLSAATRATTGCPPEGFAITAGPVDAAMGLRVMSIDLLNCGEEPYTVQGYPIIRVLDDDQQPLDVSILEGTAAIAGGIEPSDGPPQPVTADPGEHILAFVAWRNTVTDVSPITGHYLEVAPANGQSPQTVTPNGGIDLGTTGRLATGPWRTPQTS